MIYFDNAATSHPKPPQVAHAVANAINTPGSPNRGTYKSAADASRALYACRAEIATLFNTDDPLSVTFSSGATESLNTAIFGLLSPDDHVITAVTEHNASLRPLYRLGCAMDIICCDGNGQLVYDGMKKKLQPNTKAVIVSHMSNVTGNVADIAYLSHFCHENGLWLILDCAQSAGSVLVEAALADVVCFTGHKSLFGPQGTGGMIVNNVPVKPYKYGGTGYRAREHDQPSALPDRLEAGTPNGHSLAGLCAGVQFINETGLSTIVEREAMLARRFIDGVSVMRSITVYGDFTQPNRGAIVSLSVRGYGSAEASEWLSSAYDIATRPGLHCAPLMHETLGTEKSGLVRFSFSYFNTEDEIDYALDALEKM